MKDQHLLVVSNGGPTPWPLPEAWQGGRFFVENSPSAPGTLQSGKARILYKKD